MHFAYSARASFVMRIMQIDLSIHGSHSPVARQSGWVYFDLKLVKGCVLRIWYFGRFEFCVDRLVCEQYMQNEPKMHFEFLKWIIFTLIINLMRALDASIKNIVAKAKIVKLTPGILVFGIWYDLQWVCEARAHRKNLHIVFGAAVARCAFNLPLNAPVNNQIDKSENWKINSANWKTVSVAFDTLANGTLCHLKWLTYSGITVLVVHTAHTQTKRNTIICL